MFKALIKNIFGKDTGGCQSPFQVYDLLFKTLDAGQLGYGRDVHSKDKDEHWSLAYALIASSELAGSHMNRTEHLAEISLSNSVKCGQWLLDHIGCASTGAPLWTLPYPRKIWEDIEPVKVNTGFCIPSAHAIQAMFELSQEPRIGPELRDSAKNAAISAATYFSENCFDETSDGIVFWYSSLKQHSFHVTNATAMMAGQLQRVTKLAPEIQTLSIQADKAIQQLLKLRFDDVEGSGGGWRYFGEKIPKNKKNRSNDLLHEAFVCNGLLDYKQYGGRLGDQYEYSELYESLLRFYRDGRVHERPGDEPEGPRKEMLARAPAIGHALYVASRLQSLMEVAPQIDLARILFSDLQKNYIVENELYYRPNGEIVTHRVRNVAYVLLGLAEYESNLGVK